MDHDGLGDVVMSVGVGFMHVVRCVLTNLDTSQKQGLKCLILASSQLIHHVLHFSK